MNKTVLWTMRLKPSDAELIDAAVKRAKMRRSEWVRAAMLKAAKREMAK